MQYANLYHGSPISVALSPEVSAIADMSNQRHDEINHNKPNNCEGLNLILRRQS